MKHRRVTEADALQSAVDRALDRALESFHDWSLSVHNVHDHQTGAVERKRGVCRVRMEDLRAIRELQLRSRKAETT